MPKISLSHTQRAWWKGDEMHILAVLVFAALFFYFAALALVTFKEADRIGKPEPYRDTISINGKGTIKITPDVGVLSAGLETTAKTVGEAQKENTEKMNAFLARAKALGVADADKKTTQYTIYPKYEYQQKDGTGTQVKVGDSVMQTVELRVHNLPNLGALMAALGEFGLNQVGSLSFVIDDQDAVKRRALGEAIRDAETKAVAVAAEAGMRVGKAVSFYENEDSYPPSPYGMGGSSMEVKAESVAPSPEPQAGTQEVTVKITMMYELK